MLTRERLKGLGLDEREVTKISRGNSQLSLLQPQLMLDPLDRTCINDWPDWCFIGGSAYTNWLSVTDIQELLEKLMRVSDVVKELGDDDLITAYNTLMKLYATAEKANLGLLTTVSD